MKGDVIVTMKMKCFAIYLPLMIMMLGLSGCGIPQDQYDQLMSQLTSSQQQQEVLNTRVADLTKTNGEFEKSLNDAAKLNEELNTRIEDLIAANTALNDSVGNSAKLNKELSAIAAYFLWYDYYYGSGAYSFDDVTAFNSQLGSLITVIDDTNSKSAFDVYHATHYDYSTLVASLPEDNIWTQSQYESWRDAGESRKEALGQVGAHLLNKLETISWFGGK